MSFMIPREHIASAMRYEEYKRLIESLLAEGKSTGHKQTADYLEYSKVNLHRMSRIEKTTILSEELKDSLSHLKKNYYWLVLTEGWCGDASQNLPVLRIIEKSCPNIEMKLLLRDNNSSIMDQYLTNGSRSIPKMIVLEKETLQELFTWGPRPAVLQNMVLEMIGNNIAKSERGIATQKWYNDDKTQSLQREITSLIKRHMS